MDAKDTKYAEEFELKIAESIDALSQKMSDKAGFSTTVVSCAINNLLFISLNIPDEEVNNYFDILVTMLKERREFVNDDLNQNPTSERVH
jgi:hypothetical protein